VKAIIETDYIKRLIKATSKFISKDENRPILQYVKLDFKQDDLSVKAVGCDGYRIAIENAKCHSVDEDFTIFVKPYLPVGARGDYAEIELIGKKCFISVGGRSVGYEQPDCVYLDDAEIIKNIESVPVAREVFASKKFLHDALDSIQPDEYMGEPISIQIREGHGAITIKTKSGARHVLPVINPK
jgi:hypothetical protein